MVVASGDLRSTVLLHRLLNQPNHKLRLQVACPESASPRAQQLVRDLAQAHDLPYHQSPTHQLPELIKRQRARGVITANLDLRLDDVVIVHALRDLSAEQAQEYSQLHGLVWLRGEDSKADHTDPINLRRHDLEQRQRQLDQDLDQRLSKSYYQFRSVDGVRYPRPWVAQASWDQLALLLDYSMRKLAPQADFKSAPLEELVAVAKTAPAGHARHLPGSLMIRVEYDTVAIVLAGPATPPLPVMTLAPQTSVPYGRFRLIYGSHHPAGGHAITLTPGDYHVRSHRPGDRIITSAGSRKLQDVFTDHRIDRHVRASWPVICDNAETVLWVPTLTAAAQVLSESVSGYTLIAEEV